MCQCYFYRNYLFGSLVNLVSIYIQLIFDAPYLKYIKVYEINI
jgi:hypothetical protein